MFFFGVISCTDPLNVSLESSVVVIVDCWNGRRNDMHNNEKKSILISRIVKTRGAGLSVFQDPAMFEA